MTRQVRRDANVKGASVITGLRLERALAVKLVAKAREWAEGEGKGEGGGTADVAATARVLLRVASGQVTTVAAAGKLEAGPFPLRPVAGLCVDAALAAAVDRIRQMYALNTAGAYRHLLRVALGWSEDESFDLEERFATIAAARKKLATKVAANEA